MNTRTKALLEKIAALRPATREAPAQIGDGILNNLIAEAAEILADAEPVIFPCIPSQSEKFVICRIFGRLTCLHSDSDIFRNCDLRIVSTINDAQEITNGEPFDSVISLGGLDRFDFPLYPRD